MARVELSRSDEWELENSSQDVRGWDVVDASGQRVGTVKELIIDTDRERVSSLRLDSGQEIPAQEVSLGDHCVRLGSSLGSSSSSSSSSSASLDSSSESTRRTSVESASSRTEPEMQMRDRDEERLPIIEEELRIGKRQVETGGVRVESRVEERPVEEEVRLREERVTVERQPVDRPVTTEDIDNLDGRTIELREQSEEAIVDKQARVVEEVVVRKDVDERVEQVQETLRRTDVDVEKLGPGSVSSMPPSSIEDPTLRESRYQTGSFDRSSGELSSREPSSSEWSSSELSSSELSSGDLSERETGRLDSGTDPSARVDLERLERERRSGRSTDRGSLDSPSEPTSGL